MIEWGKGNSEEAKGTWKWGYFLIYLIVDESNWFAMMFRIGWFIIDQLYFVMPGHTYILYVYYKIYKLNRNGLT